jgi:Family of unknown function (DUF6325)
VSTEEIEDLGPIDIILIGFPPDAPMTGEAVPLFLDLVERGIIRVFDVLFITKDADGTFEGFEAKDLGPDKIGDLTAFDGATTGLIGDEDLAQAADALEPGTSAVLIVYENRWAAPFAAAVRRNGGMLLASDRIPTQSLIAALEAAEAAA